MSIVGSSIMLTHDTFLLSNLIAADTTAPMLGCLLLLLDDESIIIVVCSYRTVLFRKYALAGLIASKLQSFA